MNALSLRRWPAVLSVVLAMGAPAVPAAAVADPAAQLATGSAAGPVAPPTPSDPLAGSLAAPVWLCRPGQPGNPCGQDITGTATATPFALRYPQSGQRVVPDTVSAVDGTRTPFVPPDAPGVDCFYVYPTVDWMPNPPVRVGGNPPQPTDTEMAVTLLQVSPLLSRCRLFVPLYRQETLPGLITGALTDDNTDYRLGYRLGQTDIDQAWHTYWARYNRDPITGRRRGVVLLGHSQGSAVLAKLISSEIELDVEQRSQIISAVLLGGNIKVPTDRPVVGAIGTPPSSTSRPANAVRPARRCRRGALSRTPPSTNPTVWHLHPTRGSAAIPRQDTGSSARTRRRC
ncbi:MAG: DUF3089 domain-containing protein [Pseudonocardiaceae bacterium]